MAQWLRRWATNRKVAGSIPYGVIGIFNWHKILPIALWPWGRLSLKQKWVPGAFLGGKGGRCVRLTTLPPSCAVVTKSGNLNFLEASGPVQACNGTALPLPLPFWILFIFSYWTSIAGPSDRAAARLLRSWVRISPSAWMFVCCECCVLSGRGLCDELITRPEESYWLWCVFVCDLEASWMRRPWPTGGCCAKNKLDFCYWRY